MTTMSVHVIKMPDIGEGIAEVELVAWHVQPGDRVVEDQPLADVMTDKANVEIPSPVVGTVLALGGEVGEVLAVGAELLRIEVEGEAAGHGTSTGPVRTGSPQAAGGTSTGSVRTNSPAAPQAPVGAGPFEGRSPLSPLRAEPFDAARDRPVEALPRAIAAPAPAPTQAQSLPAEAPSTAYRADRPIASPSVRRRAWELGITLAQVRGTGPAGRIMQADLDAQAARSPRPAPAATARGAEAPRDAIESVKVIGLRRKIAQKMQESKRRIPHFTYVEEVDVTEVEALRARLNQRFEAERGKLTLLPLLMRALVLAVREFPQVNARFDDEAGVVARHAAVHLGIATQTGNGLMVPVVRHAEALDLWASAREVARLADAARSGRATRDELTGSTITLSSLGALGGIVSTPVINHPEVAIVGVNRIVERPVILRGAVVARQTMNLSSSFDHRVVDGVDAAQFVQALRGYLESPALLFMG
jgi:2-oxoisovalerate dehydrogenase E2 component (dihydrolipoyl transacylase)